MDFKIYQEGCQKTAVYPKDRGLEYVFLGLAGEAGELCNKYKKVIRDNNCVLTEEVRKELVKELGDTLYYVSAAATELGVSLEHVAIDNNKKLMSRLERGVIKGSGDNR